MRLPDVLNVPKPVATNTQPAFSWPMITGRPINYSDMLHPATVYVEVIDYPAARLA